MNRTTMSSTSAVVLSARWIEVHGRAPLSHECTKDNGLPHRMTIQYVCGGLTQAVALAQAVLALGLSGVSACPCSVRTVACLRCGRQIVWEGPHVRQCTRCRAQPVDEVYGTVRWAGMALGTDGEDD